MQAVLDTMAMIIVSQNKWLASVIITNSHAVTLSALKLRCNWSDHQVVFIQQALLNTEACMHLRIG